MKLKLKLPNELKIFLWLVIPEGHIEHSRELVKKKDSSGPDLTPLWCGCVEYRTHAFMDSQLGWCFAL